MLFLQSLTPNTEDIKQIEQATEQFKEKAASWFHLLLNATGEVLKELGGDLLHIAVLLLAAAIVFFVGRWIIKKLLNGMMRIFDKRKVDLSVSTFVISLTRVILYIALILGTVSIVGVKTTSFVAILAAAGFAVGMALSGTLQNFAGGVMILLLKPYKVGDYVTAQGQEGTVKSIQLFNTILTTTDNKTIILPNGPISTGIIMNTSAQKTRRVEWIVGINYGDDFAIAQKSIREILDKDARILRTPDYTIEIRELADSSVNIVVRVWVKTPDYWDVYFDINANIYKILPEKGIHFPYPQMDVHITQ